MNMKKLNYLLGLALGLLVASCCVNSPTQVSDKGTKWTWEQGTIVTEEPQRAAGQEIGRAHV